MKFSFRLILISLVLLTFCRVNASPKGIIVVANTDLTDISVNKRQVRDMFMQNNSQFGLKPVALTPDNEARFIFNTKVVGLTESRIQSYWAQMRFSGRKRPPQEFDSVQSMLVYVENNKGTVTYLPENVEIPKGLTVIYQID
jgi:hypothetical protein